MSCPDFSAGQLFMLLWRRFMVKKIGFIDYYLDEWHANNYPAWIKEASNGEYEVAYAYGEIDSPLGGRTTAAWCADMGVEQVESIDTLIEKVLDRI